MAWNVNRQRERVLDRAAKPFERRRVFCEGLLQLPIEDLLPVNRRDFIEKRSDFLVALNPRFNTLLPGSRNEELLGLSAFAGNDIERSVFLPCDAAAIGLSALALPRVECAVKYPVAIEELLELGTELPLSFRH